MGTSTGRGIKAIRVAAIVAASVYVVGVVVAHLSFSAADRAACQRAGGITGRIWCPDYVDTEGFGIHFAKALGWPAHALRAAPAPAGKFEKTVAAVKRGDAAAPAQANPEAARHAIGEVQRMLATLGYTIGDVDGVAGPRTRAAIQDFQLRDGMQVSGEVTDELVARLINAVQTHQGALPRN